MEFYSIEPFGELRADLRGAAQAFWNADRDNPEINLVHPYFTGAEERMKQHAELEARSKSLGPEHAEKLKRARAEHRAKYGK